jgi:predicted phage tail protein
MASAQQFAGLSANQEIQSSVLEKLDINVQVIAKMLKDIYGRLEQVDVLMGKSSVDFKHDFSPSEMEELKKTRDKIFQDVMSACFSMVNEERKAAIEQRRKEVEESKRAVEEAEKAKTEAERAEAVLKEAEAPPIIGKPAEYGADIPEGAEVFGG